MQLISDDMKSLCFCLESKNGPSNTIKIEKENNTKKVCIVKNSWKDVAIEELFKSKQTRVAIGTYP